MTHRQMPVAAGSQLNFRDSKLIDLQRRHSWVSKSGRARIAAAQRARWAKARQTVKVVPIRGKRTLSAAARRKIAAAQRARWARVKARKKTA
jgi:hypothetical protein